MEIIKIMVVVLTVVIVLFWKRIIRLFRPPCVLKDCEGRIVKVRGMFNFAGFDEDFKYVCKTCGTRQAKVDKYFEMVVTEYYYTKGDILIYDGKGGKSIVVSNPGSRWRRLMRFLRVNKSNAYKMRVL